MDHGHAADAAAAARSAAAAARAKEAAIAAGLPLSPSQSTNFTVNGDNVLRAASPLTPEQQKAEADGREAWQARCRPTVIEDRDGLRRTKYAEALYQKWRDSKKSLPKYAAGLGIGYGTLYGLMFLNRVPSGDTDRFLREKLGELPTTAARLLGGVMTAGPVTGRRVALLLQVV